MAMLPGFNTSSDPRDYLPQNYELLFWQDYYKDADPTTMGLALEYQFKRTHGFRNEDKEREKLRNWGATHKQEAIELIAYWNGSYFKEHPLDDKYGVPGVQGAKYDEKNHPNYDVTHWKDGTTTRTDYWNDGNVTNEGSNAGFEKFEQGVDDTFGDGTVKKITDVGNEGINVAKNVINTGVDTIKKIAGAGEDLLDIAKNTLDNIDDLSKSSFTTMAAIAVAVLIGSQILIKKI